MPVKLTSFDKTKVVQPFETETPHTSVEASKPAGIGHMADSIESVSSNKFNFTFSDALSHLSDIPTADVSVQTNLDQADYVTSLAASRQLDQLTVSAVTNQMLVENLLEQIKGLLLNVPPDQQSYWQDQFDQKMKLHFYHATKVLGDVLHPYGHYEYSPLPEDQIKWGAAYEDFSAFLQQLQAVQQPTQVPVNPADS